MSRSAHAVLAGANLQFPRGYAIRFSIMSMIEECPTETHDSAENALVGLNQDAVSCSISGITRPGVRRAFADSQYRRHGGGNTLAHQYYLE